MNKLFTTPLFNRSHAVVALNQSRLFSATVITLGKPFDKNEIDKAKSLLKNAPNWREDLATESEADVKADLEPDIDPQTLKEETAEWIRTHKDADGNIKKQ